MMSSEKRLADLRRMALEFTPEQCRDALLVGLWRAQKGVTMDADDPERRQDDWLVHIGMGIYTAVNNTGHPGPLWATEIEASKRIV